MAALNLSNLKRYSSNELNNFKRNFDGIKWPTHTAAGAPAAPKPSKKGKQKDER